MNFSLGNIPGRMERSILMGDKTKEQLSEDLAGIQKMPEEKPGIQGQMIRKFQGLIANNGLFSQIIDFLPYPIAIFTPQYTLAIMNKAFAAETKRLVENSGKENPGKEGARILKYKINDTQLAVAITRIFAGDTFFLENLKNPFSMFFENTGQSAQQTSRFNKAVVFPVPANDAEITHGAIMFMP
jgi:hypothetical protein